MSFETLFKKTGEDIQVIPGFEMNRPYKSKKLSGEIGLELEIEGRSLPSTGELERVRSSRPIVFWEAKTDGSLRGEALEYVLSSPCKASDVRLLVEGLYNTFTEKHSRLNLSNRCSTHVHINMGGKRVNELTSAIVLWTMFETVLVNFCGENRKTNHFCLTAKDAPRGSSVRGWMNFLETGHLRLGEGSKYSALNIRTLSSLGSFEVRCADASEDPEKIIKWALFVYNLFHYAFDNFPNPRDIVGAISERGATNILLDICNRDPKELGENYFNEIMRANEGQDVSYVCMDSFRDIQEMLYNNPWQDWVPLINREYVPNPFGAKKAVKTKTFVIQDGDGNPAAEWHFGEELQRVGPRPTPFRQ